MFELTVGRMSLDRDLQIVQADVRLYIDGDSVLEEAMCIDVGLPALLLSSLESTEPNRFAPAEQWEKMPFFVCGCGDPECRGYSFRVAHLSEVEAEWVVIEEAEGGVRRREQERYTVQLSECRKALLELGRRFLAYVEPLDYRPYYTDTVPVVRRLVKRLEQALQPGGTGEAG